MRQQLSSSSHFKHQHVFYKVWCQCIRDHQLIITMFYQSFSWIINGGCYNLITSYLYLVWTRFQTVPHTNTNISSSPHYHCFLLLLYFISSEPMNHVKVKQGRSSALHIPSLLNVKWAGLGVGWVEGAARQEGGKQMNL